LQITNDGVTCDWSGEWEKVDYIQLFKQHTGIDLQIASDDELRQYADSQSISYEPFAQRGRLIDVIFKKVRTNISGAKPVFLINQPLELEPLAKRDETNPKVVQRMQIIAYGTELGKGFGELNDPTDQRTRFEEQMKLREAGDSEAQMLDEDYLEAMEYGMPPAAGFGVSERLFAMLADRSIRETVVFPPMKESNATAGPAKETMVAVALVNSQAGLSSWQELNTVGHLTASLGAREGRKLLYQDHIKTKDGQLISLNIQHAIMVKSVSDGEEIRKVIDAARNQDLIVTEFTREMIETTNDKKVVELTAQKNLADVEFLGVLIFGNRKEVENLTANFPLYE
jgi:lysyl-tRNA synthetase class 2